MTALRDVLVDVGLRILLAFSAALLWAIAHLPKPEARHG